MKDQELSYNDIKTIAVENMKAALATGNKPLPMAVMGPPGCAKTALGTSLPALFSELGAGEFTGVCFNATHHEPVDVKGVMSVVGDKTRWHVPDFWPTKPNNVIVVEEFTKGPKLLQNALMEAVYDGTIGDYKVPKNTFWYFSGNRKRDGAGDEGLLSHVANRCMILNMRPDVDQTLDYFLSKQMNPVGIAFLKQNPHMLFDSEKFDGNNKARYSSEEPSFPSPRSWEAAISLLDTSLRGTLRMAAMSGIVGAKAARDFASFEELMKELPDIQMVLDDPKKCPVPKNKGVLYALTCTLSYRTSKETSKAISTYFERLDDEFVVLWLQQVAKRGNSIVMQDHNMSKHLSRIKNLVM